MRKFRLLVALGLTLLVLVVPMVASAQPRQYRAYIDMSISCDGQILSEPNTLYGGTVFSITNYKTGQFYGSCNLNSNGRCEFYFNADSSDLLFAHVYQPNIGFDEGLIHYAGNYYSMLNYHGEVVPFMCQQQWRGHLHLVGSNPF